MHQHEVVRLAGGGHPDGAGVESESVSELERGGAEDGMRVGRGAADLARELPHDAGGGLLMVADEAKAEIAVVEPAGLVTEQRLPDLEVEQLGDEGGERDRDCRRCGHGEHLGGGERPEQRRGVREGVGERGEEVGGATEDDEGAEVEHRALDLRQVGAGGEVEELEREGEEGRHDEQVTHALALHQRLLGSMQLAAKVRWETHGVQPWRGGILHRPPAHRPSPRRRPPPCPCALPVTKRGRGV
uniref:DUF834 domain-containing protein n=1 Tax=Oryza glumipatula TaxID=40148 RepID=A0A0E0A801_9ORYZ